MSELAPQYRRPYFLSGDATTTIVSRRTGTRFTYRIERAPARAGQPADRVPHFVAVLTGPENGSDYTFLGTIFADGNFRRGPTSSIAPDAPSALAFAWAWRHLDDDKALELVVYHSGRCGRCGRELTTPESIERGLGPVCAGEA